MQATVLLSGGIDSAAAAVFMLRHGSTVQGLHLSYGQAAQEQELQAAKAVCSDLGIAMHHLTLRGGRAMKTGELTGRNAFFVFTALLAGEATDAIVLGIHSGTPYYDCSSAFIGAMEKIVAEHTDRRVMVAAPFIQWTKRDIFEYFLESRISPARTYSCEAGTPIPCGACASCVDRRTLGC